jgi:hypothetical protein
MRFKFTVARESLEMLSRLLRIAGKFWEGQRVCFLCNLSGVLLYPEYVSSLCPTYCQLFLPSPTNATLPTAATTEGAGGDVRFARPFFESYVISSEKAQSKIVFSGKAADEFTQVVQVMASLHVESVAVFKLMQESVQNFIRVWPILTFSATFCARSKAPASRSPKKSRSTSITTTTTTPVCSVRSR